MLDVLQPVEEYFYGERIDIFEGKMPFYDIYKLKTKTKPDRHGNTTEINLYIHGLHRVTQEFNSEIIIV